MNRNECKRELLFLKETIKSVYSRQFTRIAIAMYETDTSGRPAKIELLSLNDAINEFSETQFELNLNAILDREMFFCNRIDMVFYGCKNNYY